MGFKPHRDGKAKFRVLCFVALYLPHVQSVNHSGGRVSKSEVTGLEFNTFLCSGIEV